MSNSARNMNLKRRCNQCGADYSAGEDHRCLQPDVSTPEKARAHIMGKIEWLKTPDQVDTFVGAIATLLHDPRAGGRES